VLLEALAGAVLVAELFAVVFVLFVIFEPFVPFVEFPTDYKNL
jgi:hypothetical protein